MASFLTLNEVSRRTSLSPSAINRLVVLGKFPAPVVISLRRKAWLDTAIDEWVDVVVKGKAFAE
jgi:predicted DNA-binding transcriptional regulator AlpA